MVRQAAGRPRAGGWVGPSEMSAPVFRPRKFFEINGSGKACCVAAAGKLSALGRDLGEG